MASKKGPGKPSGGKRQGKESSQLSAGSSMLAEAVSAPFGLELVRGEDGQAIAPLADRKAAFMAWENNAIGPEVGTLTLMDGESVLEQHQLRAGRWVVGSELKQQRDGTLLLNDPAVSGSHAILRVFPEGRVAVIDTASEHGTYYRKNGTAKEQRLGEEAVIVFDGDTLRFGGSSAVIRLRKA